MEKAANGNSPGHGFDLEPRTEKFAKDVRGFVKKLPKSISNFEDVKQLVRASGSVAANYVEANEALSKKDFVMRIKICRKEAKESGLFLRLLDSGDQPDIEKLRWALDDESKQLTKIFGSILTRSTA
ncbi:MAG: four helix bundle protein [Verrucomicrobiae bacterium]|nr:four helix bundle protein [Verrucomicrobiae bacterium]MCB1086423.1 four helix bundle protein [Verrucomicrobiae bacterium]MCB1091242.1 four helix bundle protein [Verrucomicrobiae bacterium]